MVGIFLDHLIDPLECGEAFFLSKISLPCIPDIRLSMMKRSFSGSMFGWGIGPLSVKFPDLFRRASNQLAKVKDYMVSNNNRTSWGPIFRRNLVESEVEKLLCLLQRLESIFIPQEGSDWRVWISSQDGVFSVSSFFLTLSTNFSSKNQFEYLWKSKVPPRVIAFGWLVLRGSILTLDNLRKHSVGDQCLSTLSLC